MSKKVSVEEVQKHASADDLWICVDNKVYDMTEYAPNHPGGPTIIYKYAGKDATAAYSEVHAPSVIKQNLDESKIIGDLDESTINEEWKKSPEQNSTQGDPNEKPPLLKIVNLFDFEDVAEKQLSEKNWAFYSGAATDLITRDKNKEFLDRIFFRPRLLRNVSTVDTRSKILGTPVDMPLFVSPAAMAKLAHPEGEKALARGAASSNIIQCICSNASFSLQEIMDATPKDYPVFFQLYVNTDRAKTRELLPQIVALRPQMRALFVTIDAPVPGKREADERLKADETLSVPISGGSASNDARGGGLGRTLGSYIDKALAWEDLKWIRDAVGPDLPIVLKGVQCAADAKLAQEAGMQGILVSNHGGRSLDTSPPAVLTLLELHRCCPEIFDSMEVYVDSGVRRGTDILKLLCLGATAVGLGRSFLYSLVYGEEGVQHLVDILKDELETSMRLVGIQDLSQVSPDYINSGDIDHLIPKNMLGHPYARWKPKASL